MKIQKLTFFAAMLIFISVSCTKSDIDVEPNNQLSKNKKARTASCGAFLSGQHYSQGYYNYGTYTIDLTNYHVGATITIYCNSVEVPNRFNLQGPGQIKSTGWIGWSSLPGPWGGSLNGPGTSSITVTKQSASDNIFTFSVETVVQGNQTDAWEASISCYNPPCP
jgi:hypothetical protein